MTIPLLLLQHLRISHGYGRRFSALALPNITNEPFLHYAPGSSERLKLLSSCKIARTECPDIPLVINGQAIRTGDIGRQV
jgi:1-pyrroline-5-carboxylate dehydrogenase